MSKIGRNDSCPCGSGKKYKKCCELNLRKGPRQFKASLLSNNSLSLSKTLLANGESQKLDHEHAARKKNEEKAPL